MAERPGPWSPNFTLLLHPLLESHFAVSVLSAQSTSQKQTAVEAVLLKWEVAISHTIKTSNLQLWILNINLRKRPGNTYDLGDDFSSKLETVIECRFGKDFDLRRSPAKRSPPSPSPRRRSPPSRRRSRSRSPPPRSRSPSLRDHSYMTSALIGGRGYCTPKSDDGTDRVIGVTVTRGMRPKIQSLCGCHICMVS